MWSTTGFTPRPASSDVRACGRKVLEWPRIAAYSLIGADLTVRFFGGYSLLALARPVDRDAGPAALKSMPETAAIAFWAVYEGRLHACRIARQAVNVR